MSEFEDHVTTATEAERRGDVTTAIAEYRRSLSLAAEASDRVNVLLRLGRCLLETELDEAADRFAEARREANASGEDSLLGQVDLADAKLAMLRGQHRLAGERLASAETRLGNDREMRLELDMARASAERHRGELAASLTRLKALDRTELEAHPLVLAEYLDELGATLLASGDYRAAVSVLEEAVALDHRLNSTDEPAARSASARSRLLLAEALMGCGDRRQAKHYIEDVRSSTNPATAGMSDVYALRGRWYEEGNEFATAARDYRLGLEIDRESDDDIGQARALQCLARVRRKQGNRATALEYLEEAKNLAQAGDDDLLMARILAEEGEVRLEESDYPGAIERFLKVLDIALEDGDERSAAIAKRQLARAYSENGDHSKAEQLLREALEPLRAIGDLRELDEALDDLGAVLIERDQYSEAVVTLNESLELDERLGTISSRARSLRLLSRAYLKQGDRARAGECIQSAADVYEDSEDEVGRTDVLADLGAWLMQEGKLTEAKTAFSDAFRLDNRHDDRVGMARSLRGLGAVYRSMGDLVRARESIDEAAEYLSTLRDTDEQSLLELELGQLLQAEGNPAEAERSFRAAMAGFTRVGAEVEVATCKRLLGRLFGEQGGRHRAALELFHEAQPVFEQFNDAPELDRLYDDMGLLYLRLGRLKEARTAVDKSMQLGALNGWRHGQGASFVLLGKINVAEDDDLAAQRNFEDALRAFEDADDDAGISTAQLELGDLAASAGRLDDALEHYRSARRIDQVLRDFLGLARVFRKLGDVYFRRDEYERASESYDQAEEHLRAFRDARQEAALALSRGILASRRGLHLDAIRLYDEALRRFGEVDDTERMIATYSRLATSYQALGRVDEALKCVREMGLEEASLWNSLLRNYDSAVAAAATDKFANQSFDDAVKDAFTEIERRFRTHDESGDPTRSVAAVIREWVKPDRRGVAPFLNERELSEFANFCTGAFSLIRNPVVHGRRTLSGTDAMAALGVAHVIIGLIEAPEEPE